MKKLILLSFILPLIASCGSNDSEDNLTIPDPIKSKKLIEVKKDGNAYYKFKYNDNGSISEIYNYFNGLINATTKIEYSNNLQIKYSQYNSNNSLSSYQVFTYQGNLITNRKIYFVNNGIETLNSSADYTNDFSKKKQ